MGPTGFFDRKNWTWVSQSVARKSVRDTRVTLNFIQGIITDLRAMLTRERPQWGVYSGTSDSIDVASSRYGEAWTKWAWRQFRLGELYGDSVEFAAQTGTWYIEPQWDKNAGREIDGDLIDITEMEFEEREDEFGNKTFEMVKEPEPVFERVREGNLRWRLLSVFEVINAPGSSADFSGEAVITQQDLRLSDVQSLYGEAAEGVVPDAGPDESGASEVHRLRIMSAAPYLNSSNNEYYESVRVYKCYVRQCLKYPKGREVHFTQSKILYEGDNPAYLQDGEKGEEPRYHFPIFPIRFYKRASAWHGKSAVQDLVGPQLALNGAASKELKILKDHAHPRLRVPVGSKVDVNNASDGVIEYSPRFGPDEVSYLDPGNVPPALRDLAERYRMNMEIIAGTAGLNRSYAEDSGRKLQQMQQASLGKLQPVKEAIDEAWTDAIHYAMTLWRRNATSDRQILVVGENHTVDMFVFNENSMSGTHDVILHNDTALPKDPQARQLAIRNILESTANLPPELRQQAWELYGVKDFLRVEQDMWADRNRAREENLLMLQGQDVQVEFWEDDHQHNAAHITEMNTTSFRARVQAEGGPRESPTYQRFVMHLQQHSLNLQAKSTGGAVTGQGMPNQSVVPPAGLPSPQPALPPPGPQANPPGM